MPLHKSWICAVQEGEIRAPTQGGKQETQLFLAWRSQKAKAHLKAMWMVIAGDRTSTQGHQVLQKETALGKNISHLFSRMRENSSLRGT